MDRAHAVRPSFSITLANTAAVIEIVTRLDGIPLAIELAAARVKLLSAEQIADRLSDRFRLLSGGGRRTVLPRQQTLRGAIDWSYDLLEEEERALLRRLAVFAGSWTVDAAMAVCADSRVEAEDVLDLLGRLVDRSLVVVIEGVEENRFGLLETIRQSGVSACWRPAKRTLLKRRIETGAVLWLKQQRPSCAGARSRCVGWSSWRGIARTSRRPWSRPSLAVMPRPVCGSP
jgi:predicted ATPase